MNRRLKKLNRSRERFHRLYNTKKYGSRYCMEKRNTTDRSRSDYISPTSSGSGGGADAGGGESGGAGGGGGGGGGGGADVGGGDQESFLYGDLRPLSRQRTDSSLQNVLLTRLQKLTQDILDHAIGFLPPSVGLNRKHAEGKKYSIKSTINLDEIPDVPVQVPEVPVPVPVDSDKFYHGSESGSESESESESESDKVPKDIKFTKFSNKIDSYHNLISLKITGLGRVRNDYKYISKIGQKNVLPTLEILDISGDGLGSKAMEEFQKRGFSLPNLKILNISNNEIGPDGARTIALAIKKGGLPNLTSLDVSFNEIGTIGARVIASAITSGKLPNLTSLDIGGYEYEIGPEGDQAIAKLKELKSLGISLNLIDRT